MSRERVDRLLLHLVLLAVLCKGAIMSATLYLLGITFVDQLVIAVVSATLTGIFVMLGVWYTAREARRNRQAITTAKEEVQVTVREERAANGEASE